MPNKGITIKYKRVFKTVIILTILFSLLAFTTSSGLPSVEAYPLAPLNTYSTIPSYTRAYRIVAIPVEFPDKPHQKPVDEINELIFERLNLYFDEVSYGSIQFTGVIPDWIEVPKKLPYYGSDEGGIDWRAPTLIKHAVNLAVNRRNIELDDYDLIIVIHAGPGQETSRVSSDIWSACWTGLKIQVGLSTEVSTAVVLPEYEEHEVDLLGSYAHEILHSLGLDDAGRNVGKWDVMGRGVFYGKPHGSCPAHPCSYNKIKMGWIGQQKIESITQDGVTAISPIENASMDACMVVKVPLDASSYYLIELRTRQGFDSHIAASGLLVTLVEWRKDMNDWQVTLIPLDDGDIANDWFIDAENNLKIEGYLDPSNQTYVKVSWL